jgi:hypothetical protein
MKNEPSMMGRFYLNEFQPIEESIHRRLAMTEPVYHQVAIGSHVEYNTIGHAQDLFFAYDNMNRQILVDGAVDNNANNLANVTPGQGHILAYDHNGNRIEDRSWSTQVTPEYVQNYDESGTALGAPQLVGYQTQTGIQTTWYSYDKMNRLSTVATGAYGQVQTGVQQTGVDESGQPIYSPVYTTQALGQAQAIVLDTRLYDGVSRVVQSGPAGSLPAAYVKALTDGNLNLSGATTTVSQYDADGRVLSQAVTNEADPSSSTTTKYTEYDAAGNLEAYQTTQGVNGDTIVTNTTITPGDAGLRPSRSDIDGSGGACWWCRVDGWTSGCTNVTNIGGIRPA